MNETVTVHIDSRRAEEIARKLNVTTRNFFEAIAFQIEGLAKQKAPIKTGALRNSIYTATQSGNNMPMKALVKIARSKKGKAGNVAQRNVDPIPSPRGNVIAIVGPCVEYGYWVEHGSSHRAAKPYLVPAVEEVTRRVNGADYGKKL